ncbi:hypothetical protein DENSPDRAFT_421228 [Dentipellis sp. KUC8613]|nr:hypothetical protein DENSPDRAFT_421228 [Dentipellis sp. KUC8613]
MPSNVVTALEVSGQIASAIPFNAVGLQGIFGAAKAIAELLDAVRSDRLACQVLSGKASRLVAHVSKIVERQADGAVSEDFQGSIEDLEKYVQFSHMVWRLEGMDTVGLSRSMNEVTAKLAKIVDSKLWRRVFHRRRNSETLKECTSLLDEAWRKFDTTALLLIQRIQCDILSRQAYDETHRIFRLCELRLYEVPHAEPDAIYEQAVGEIVDPHRCVLVRRMKPGVDVELFWKEVDQLKDICRIREW